MVSDRSTAVLRPATTQDVAVMRRVALDSKAYWGYPGDVLDRFDETLELDETYTESHIAVVAVAGSRIIGFYGVEPRGDIAWLEDLWVVPLWIRGGVGRLLFEHAQAAAAEVGARTLQWEADINAVPFYERMGGVFERWSETTEFGRRLPIMRLDLSALK